MNIEKILGAIAIIAGGGYLLVTGKLPSQPWKLFEQDEKAVILVGRDQALVSNDLNFMVGERLYFHLKTEAYVPRYVSWRFEGHPVQQGIRFNTQDIDKNIDLETLERSTIPKGGFLIEAVFLNDKKEDDSVDTVISFRERDEPPRQQASSQSQRGRSNEQDEPTGSISYKGDEVIGNNNDICTLNTHNVAYRCPE